MSLANIMKRLESTNSRLDKEAILTQAINNPPIGFVEMFRRALDTYETFGVKQVPESTNSAGLNEEYALQYVTSLMNDLSSRTLTGNAAAEEISRVAELVNADDWNNFYRRALLKDMRCGVNVTTWNKVAGDKAVPVFSCQLAKDGAKEKKIGGEKYVEVKLDGVRVISIVHPDGRVDMHSRNGKRLTNFPKIEEALSKYAIDTPFVLDGEVMSSSFQDLMKQVHRKDDVQTDDACLYLFDIVSYRSFRQGTDTAPQRVRSEILKNTVKDEDCVKVVQQTPVDLDTQIGQRIFREINAKAIEGGYEGIMLKDPEAPYETKRTKSWLKIKPVIEVTLEVVDVEEGTGKYVGSTGALVCRGSDTGREIAVNVGSGLTDADRDNIWNSKSEVIGQLVEIKADAITQNQDGTYSLRFPRFKCFRGFEAGEKL
jgi:DNA ligase-1